METGISCDCSLVVAGRRSVASNLVPTLLWMSIADHRASRFGARVARASVGLVKVVEAQRRVVDPGRGDLLAATHRHASASAPTRRDHSPLKLTEKRLLGVIG